MFNNCDCGSTGGCWTCNPPIQISVPSGDEPSPRQGWQCPVCKRVWAIWAEGCRFCNKKGKRFTNPMGGDIDW
jgi:hypothetical protein